LSKGGRFAVIAAAAVVISASAFGTGIGAGQDQTAGVVTVDLTGIHFSNFVTTGPDTGAYAGNTTVTQMSLIGAPNLNPNIAQWASFTVPSGIIWFDLNTLNAGAGTNAGCASNAVGTLCTPTGSPVTLDQLTASTVILTLTGNGIAYMGTSTGGTPTIVSFSSQNNIPGTISGILAQVANGGFTDSVSATYSSVPEPLTFSMMGIGLLGLGLIARRRKI